VGRRGERARCPPSSTADRGATAVPRTESGSPTPPRTAGAPNEPAGGRSRLLELLLADLLGSRDPPVLGMRTAAVHGLLLAARVDADRPPVHELPHADRRRPDVGVGRPLDLPFGGRAGPDRSILRASRPRAFTRSAARAPARRASPSATGPVGSSAGAPSPIGTWSEIPRSRAWRAAIESSRSGPGPTSTAAPMVLARSIHAANPEEGTCATRVVGRSPCSTPPVGNATFAGRRTP